MTAGFAMAEPMHEPGSGVKQREFGDNAPLAEAAGARLSVGCNAAVRASIVPCRSAGLRAGRPPAVPVRGSRSHWRLAARPVAPGKCSPASGAATIRSWRDERHTQTRGITVA